MTEAARQRAALSAMARDVKSGLLAASKSLPPYLFYDEQGSKLYEQITELPEYYPTRTERAIFQENADEMVRLAATGSDAALKVVELGAGTASKTRLILEAVVRRQGRCLYVPIDVSSSALDEAKISLEAVLPSVEVRPFHGRHEEAFETIVGLGPRRLAMFIGSSVGNFDDPDAISLLRGVRRGLGDGGALLLGTDLRKSPGVLIPAYDDSAGVTAAFNKNILTHINRELGADFDLGSFTHVALWNERESRIEMHLESTLDQQVKIASLDLFVSFKKGERIHTESSIKYDLARVDRVLSAAGLVREKTFEDSQHLFGVHLARVAE